MNIAIIIAFLVAFILQGVIILQAVKHGLKWQIQVKRETLPTIDNPVEPIKQVIEEKKLEQKIKEYKNAFEEYINGAPEGEGK